MLTYSIILQGAESSEEEALYYVQQIDWSEQELNLDHIAFKRFIKAVGDIAIWYDYSADYFFFSPVQLNQEIKRFYEPVQNSSGKAIPLMRYCNNGLSYGIYYDIDTGKTRFCLCESPTLEMVINKILSEHDSLDELRDAFYSYRNNYC